MISTFVKNFDQFFGGLNKVALLVLVVFLEIVIGWADYETGLWVPFRVFYVIPLFLASWYGNKTGGMVISLFSAGIGSYDVYRALPLGSSIWLFYYNLIEEGLLFGFFFLFIFQLRVQFFRSLHEKTDLQKTVSLLNATLESTTDGILVVDKEGKTILLFNDQFLDLWHVPKELVQKINETHDDRPLLTYVTSQLKDPILFFEKVKALYHHPSAESFDTLKLVDERIFERYSKPQLLDGKYYGRVWSFRDVTEKKKAESELIKSMKLESIGLLAGGIAHDFNNILTAILGNVSLARVELEPSHSSSKYLIETEKATLKAKDLADQLLTFSKGGAPQKKIVSIAPLLQEAITFALRGSSIQARFHFPDNLWAAEIDPSQITQLVHNLAINAKQAMGEGGEVAIRAENIMIDERLASQLSLTPGFYIWVSFQDNGEGIPEENLDKIFDPFFTTKKSGSGLGLFSAYSIARNHNGALTVASQLGNGTSFFLYLPAVTDRKALEDSNHATILFGSGRILLMDDDEMVRQMASAMLQTLGYEVEVASKGEKALEMYRKAREKNLPFEAVILDLTVQGGKGGKQTLQELLAYDPGARAIVSSGYSNDPVMADFRASGFKGSVAKPYRIQDLSKTLNAVLKNDLSRQQKRATE
jgi:signal transduction histidine kinase/ActR/RegA family two-component response regulator